MQVIKRTICGRSKLYDRRKLMRKKYCKIVMKDFGSDFEIVPLDEKLDRNKWKSKSQIKKNIYLWSVITVLLSLICIFYIKEAVSISNILNKFVIIFILTVLLIVGLMELKGLFVAKILFGYKTALMNMYYNCLNIDGILKNPEESEPRLDALDEAKFERVIIPITDNGSLIGIVEGFLYAIGVICMSPIFIGIVLALRSYVSVSSHPNKEESEFYIIGLLGSLLCSIAFTLLYILLVDTMTSINLFHEIQKYMIY